MRNFQEQLFYKTPLDDCFSIDFSKQDLLTIWHRMSVLNKIFCYKKALKNSHNIIDVYLWMTVKSRLWLVFKKPLTLRKKWSFPLRVSSVSVSNPQFPADLVWSHLLKKSLFSENWRTSFFVKCELRPFSDRPIIFLVVTWCFQSTRNVFVRGELNNDFRTHCVIKTQRTLFLRPLLFASFSYFQQNRLFSANIFFNSFRIKKENGIFEELSK